MTLRGAFAMRHAAVLFLLAALLAVAPPASAACDASANPLARAVVSEAAGEALGRGGRP